MVSVEEAWQLISQAAVLLPSEKVKVSQASERIVAENILAPLSLPPFDNSAVDGFVLTHDHLAQKFPLTLKISGIIAAGDTAPSSISPQETWRIMTGAMLPAKGAAVVMQEQVSIENEHAVFSQPLKINQNIRALGEDVSAGQTIVSQGERLTAGSIGLLLALGISEVTVRKKPTVALISTGSELVEAGYPLMQGQVYYCTGPMLAAQAESFGGRIVSMKHVKDDLALTIQALQDECQADIVLLVGGMAVGRFDFGREALKQSGIEEVFYLGKWRPGKPLYFGKRNFQYIFGLPGNPVSCFVMNAIFVQALIRAIQAQSPTLLWKKGILAEDFSHEARVDIFLRAELNDNNEITILAQQGSHHLSAVARANALCHVEAQAGLVRKGSVVRFLPL